MGQGLKNVDDQKKRGDVPTLSEQISQKVLDDLFKGVLGKSSQDGPDKNLMKEWESYM